MTATRTAACTIRSATSEICETTVSSRCPPTVSPYAIRSVSRRLNRRIARMVASGSVEAATSVVSVAANDAELSGRPCPIRTCSHASGSLITNSARYGLAEKIFSRISSACGSR